MNTQVTLRTRKKAPLATKPLSVPRLSRLLAKQADLEAQIDALKSQLAQVEQTIKTQVRRGHPVASKIGDTLVKVEYTQTQRVVLKTKEVQAYLSSLGKLSKFTKSVPVLTLRVKAIDKDEWLALRLAQSSTAVVSKGQGH